MFHVKHLPVCPDKIFEIRNNIFDFKFSSDPIIANYFPAELYLMTNTFDLIDRNTAF